MSQGETWWKFGG